EFQRKELETVLATAEKEAAEARAALATEASRVKTEFLANVSHELRTPLTSIIGFAELMHQGLPGPVNEDQKEYLGDILDCGRHLRRMVNDLLDLASMEAGTIQFCAERSNLHELVASVAASFGPVARDKRLHLETHIADGLTGIEIDPSRLRQVLYNYVSNALKFTPEGGTVTIRLSVEEPGWFRVEVEDTGHGIKPADLGRLFERFVQLTQGEGLSGKSTGGTGIGLSLTKRIVEAQGGTVGVRSTPGSGSVFHAILPRKPQMVDPLFGNGEGGGGNLTMTQEDLAGNA
ncbi:MAG: HAMP domain-containing sensor histidine kinase, partial [Bryobacteraceae bacterium]